MGWGMIELSRGSVMFCLPSGNIAQSLLKLPTNAASTNS